MLGREPQKSYLQLSPNTFPHQRKQKMLGALPSWCGALPLGVLCGGQWGRCCQNIFPTELAQARNPCAQQQHG
eukprot:687387-Amphidinium_carterae.1